LDIWIQEGVSGGEDRIRLVLYIFPMWPRRTIIYLI